MDIHFLCRVATAPVRAALIAGGVLVASSLMADSTSSLTRAECLRKFQDQEIATAASAHGYVITTGTREFPRIVWRDVDEVRNLVGDVPLRTRWFDADGRESTCPQKIGRYTALVEGTTSDGMAVRRGTTLFCAPELFGLWFARWKQPVLHPGGPFDEKVWSQWNKANPARGGDMIKRAMMQTEEGAMILSGLYEAQTSGALPVGLSSPEVLNDEAHLRAKLAGTGRTDAVHHLAPPRTINPPARVLRKGSPREAGMRPDAKERIDRVCREWARTTKQPFCTLVARHGVIVTHEAFGRNPDGQPITREYRADVASITKMLTGLLFARFLDQGIVRLDDPLSVAIPDFPTTGPHAITFRHCFTHTTGLQGIFAFGDVHKPHLENIVRNGVEALQPGKAYSYTNTSIDLAAKAMEWLSGKSAMRLIHEDLFRPLGIQDVPMGDMATGAQPTAYELAILAQTVANGGSYGKQEVFSRETLDSMLPQNLTRFFPGVDRMEGVAMGVYPLVRAARNDKDTTRTLFGNRSVGHGSLTGCIMRIDLDKDLIITQVRGGQKPADAEYFMRFYEAIVDSIKD